MLAALLSSVNLDSLSTQYSTSQYCLSGYREQHGWDQLSAQYGEWCGSGEIFDGNINDPDLFTLSGWYYLRGADPTSINPELQPLTKYFFGISTLIFGSPLIVQWLMGLALIVTLLIVSREILPKIIFILPAVLLLSDKLFLAELKEPYLDLSITLFVNLYLYCLYKFKTTKTYLYPAMILLGLTALSKSFSLGILAAITGFTYLLLVDQKLVVIFLKTLWVPVATYLLGYIAFFFYHHNPIDIITLHIDILRLYKSYVPEYPKGEIFRIIFSGKWRQWFGDFGLANVPEWSIFWPISLVASFITILVKKLHTNNYILLHLIWIIIYLIFVSFRLVFPRYLGPILPSMYIVFSCLVSKLVSSFPFCYSSINGRIRRRSRYQNERE